MHMLMLLFLTNEKSILFYAWGQTLGEKKAFISAAMLEKMQEN